MKNFKIASAIALAMGIAVVGTASAASSAGGTINFKGALTDTTCTIQGGENTDEGTGNFTVQLTPTPASDMTAAGDVAGHTPFSVKFGAPGETTCQNGKVASLMFDSLDSHIDASTGALKNVLTGEATNAEIQLTMDDKTAINLSDASAVVMSPAIANNQAIIRMGAQYLAVNAAPTAGLVSSAVVYKVTYN
ncbi:major type 1 subunit fimbrin (pilin) [Dyella sp. OK004]|uniref:fimbrial protein n=1 Tax=Dyella sp. OK004 TaxID=1855292 RepID=UPI0008ED1328|nr:fimbrial protein [Dyella sp. OK004]SFR95181.1 major type 1 subunit fimbrin (pilin) [Dyella sp. OK004]